MTYRTLRLCHKSYLKRQQLPLNCNPAATNVASCQEVLKQGAHRGSLVIKTQCESHRHTVQVTSLRLIWFAFLKRSARKLKEERR